ncbi:MAG TPA: c-type cytochrome biogenesis protein CcsB [Microbacteriaceae bacterium]|nr:c-type cytochrome biogenesis protein CcsB [Microbacteriaceae bacterium]
MVTAFLSQLSVIVLYASLAVYAAAFISFAMDVAGRAVKVRAASDVTSAVARRAESALAREAGAAGQAGSGHLATMTKTANEVHEHITDVNFSRSQTVGMALTVVALAFELVADVLRGIAAGRVPWSDMYEFSMTGTVLITIVFLIMAKRYNLRFLGVFITGLVLVLMGISVTRYYVAVVPLPPALQSYWLVIHVLVAMGATGFFALGFALSVAQLMQARRETQIREKMPVTLRFLETLPGSNVLENLAYRVNITGFILWTFTLIAGAIWAEKAWGNYWGWDTKEVWTFIIWVLYAGFIHARATRGWRGSRSAWLAIVGFGAVMFNFGIVNVFFHGLHSYSGL